MLSHRVIFHGRRVLPRPQAGLRRLPGGPALPVVRRGRDDPVKAAKLVKSPAQVATSA